VNQAAVSLDEFVESMLDWAKPMVARRARWRGDHPVLSHADLLQEAKCVLVKVWNDYAGRVPEGEMRRVGTRAIHFHLGNIWHSTEAKSRKARVVSLDGESLGEGDRHPHVVGVRHPATVNTLTGLDALCVRDTLERLALSASERRVLAEVMDPSDIRAAQGLPSAEAMKIFGRLRGKIRRAFYEGGYSHAGSKTKTKGPGGREEHDMDGVKGPESPHAENVTTGTPAQPSRKRSHKKDSKKTPKPKAAKKAPKPKAAKKAPKPKAASTVLSASDTKRAAGAFAKDQRVRYVGGGRAPWLKAGAELVIKGPVECRGRTYVRCYAVDAQRAVSLSPTLLK